MRPAIAVVEPFSSAAMLAPALRDAGFSPVAVVNQHEPDFAALHGEFTLRDYDVVINHHGDDAETTERLGALAPAAVIPGIEGSLHLAQRLAEALTPSCANVSELVDARRHKYLMQQAVAAAGLPVIRQICTADASEVQEWITSSGLEGHDLVVKPPASAGTIGVSLAPGGRGWREQFEALVGSRDKLGVLNEQALVQEHVTGTECVVDTVSWNGRHSVTDLLRYQRVRLGEGMAVYDSVEWIPYDLDRYGELVTYGLRALDAVGLRHWAAHTEIMMTPDGPRLLEINARLAGAGNPAVTQIASGASQVTRIVDICRGLGPSLPEGFTLQRHVMAVFLIAHSTGIVRNAEIYEKARLLPSYHSPVHLVQSGMHVDATTDILTSMQMGYIILAHESADQVYADREAVRALEQELVIEPS